LSARTLFELADPFVEGLGELSLSKPTWFCKVDLEHVLARDPMVENAAINARMGDNEDRLLVSVGKCAFDLIPGCRVDRPEVILELRTPKCVMLKLPLRVTKYQRAAAFPDEVNHRKKRRLLWVVALANPPYHEPLRKKVSMEFTVGALIVRPDN
jgi:hypothetical protein